jgi:hypothetical protein
MKPLTIDEIGSIYDDPNDRYIVSLVVTYGDASKGERGGVHSPLEAAWYALDLTRDAGSGDAVWFVFDRETGHMHAIDQVDIEKATVESTP